MDFPGQSAIDIKEFASRIVALEALGKSAKSPVPRVTNSEICALVYRVSMYRERLGGIKGMRPAGSLEPISLFQGSTFLDVPYDFVVRTTRPAQDYVGVCRLNKRAPLWLNDLQRLNIIDSIEYICVEFRMCKENPYLGIRNLGNMF